MEGARTGLLRPLSSRIVTTKCSRAATAHAEADRNSLALLYVYASDFRVLEPLLEPLRRG